MRIPQSERSCGVGGVAEAVQRWLLRFGYDGQGYRGWARQPGQRTIEGTLREGLIHSGLVRTMASPDVEVASRTDAGVSARSNALALSTTLPVDALLRALNGLSETIFFTAGRPIPKRFRVRHALWREYRYYLPGDRSRARGLARVLRSLPLELDVRTFGRGLSSARPVRRTIDSARVRFDGQGVRIDLRARSFVWGMVRKIVGGLLWCESGQLAIDDLVEAAKGRRRLSLPLAPADALLLWEVRYPGRWPTWYRPSTREQNAHLSESVRKAEVRLRLTRALREP